MRVLQLIDSLDAGGAERMAVNYANTLANKIEFSGLAVSRKEGELLAQLSLDVPYCYLNKKSIFDLASLFRLRKFVMSNKIEIVHAHSTSFFMAFLLKLTCSNVKLIWHDHYGNSEFLNERPSIILKLVLPFFSGIIAVNHKLKIWALQKLNFKNVIYLPNFSSEEVDGPAQTILTGVEAKRILSLANLRAQKDHFLLLEVAKKVKLSHPEWTFHLVGKDFEDDYAKKIKALIVNFDLSSTVFVYGSRNDIMNIIRQSDIGILTSKSEGLPVALLEYGFYKKPVVVSNVGEISLVIQDSVNGFLVENRSVQFFYNAIVKLMESSTLRNDFGQALKKTVEEKYSEKAVVFKYINWLANSIK